jgi:hypothetical protein
MSQVVARDKRSRKHAVAHAPIMCCSHRSLAMTRRRHRHRVATSHSGRACFRSAHRDEEGGSHLKTDSFPAEDLRTKEQFPVIPTNDRRSGEPYAAAAIMAAVIIAGILLTTGLRRLADDWGPQTGDIISFPATKMPSISTASITVNPAGASISRPCVLDVHVMQKFGGSLVVEVTRFEPERGFQVHWAGVRTGDGLEDCGGSVDLDLNSAQMGALIFAAGGTGVKAQN